MESKIKMFIRREKGSCGIKGMLAFLLSASKLAIKFYTQGCK